MLSLQKENKNNGKGFLRYAWRVLETWLKKNSESKGSGLIYSVYAYYDDESEGIFAVRETKEAAIEALKKRYQKEIFW